jgi:cysteine desulfurase
VSGDSLYFDFAASTPVAEEVLEAMLPHLRGGFANPSSAHRAGRRSAAAVERSAEGVAGLVGADPAEIVWTSGATESNNLALAGAARYQRERHGRDHIVTSRTEHKSVLATCQALEREGFRVSYLAVAPDGSLDPDALAAVVDDRTAVVSVMHVNNETGVVQDVPRILEPVRESGAVAHVDAVQAAGRLPVDLSVLDADLVSLSAHKLYGPKGAGALYVRRRRGLRLRPLLHGGGQQNGLRPGTLPVHQIVGMGAAFQLAADRREADLDQLGLLHERLRRGLSSLDGVVLNGRADGSPHILNASFVGVHGDALTAELGERLCVSAGSACSAADGSPSHVLRAMGRPDALAHASLRFSLGRSTTERDVDAAVEIVAAALARLRPLSPVWRAYRAGYPVSALYNTEITLPLA